MTAILSLMLLVGTSLPLDAESRSFDEYQVKAAFLYNFAKFVEWPADSLATPTEPIQMCVFGQDPFGSTLESIVQGKKLGDRAFVVRHVGDAQRASKCQILFIGAGEWKQVRALIVALKGASVLTVGETDDFTSFGGMIAFQLEGPRVRIQIAPESAERARLRISSKLLSLAEIVKRQP